MTNIRTSMRCTNLELNQSIVETISSSPTNKRKISSVYLTQKRNNYEEQILQRYGELNNCIEQLDEKIHKLIQNNEAQILLAYRNHLIKIKKEMKQFKEEALAQVQNQMNYQGKIDKMERQLIVFREEALKLFTKITQKDKIIEELKLTVYQLETEKKFMDETVKTLTKRLKQLQIKTITNATANIEDPFLFKSSKEFKLLSNTGNNFRLAAKQIKIKQKMFTSSVNYNHRNSTSNSKIDDISNNRLRIQTSPSDQLSNFSYQNEELEKYLRLKLNYIDQKILKDLLSCTQNYFLNQKHNNKFGRKNQKQQTNYTTTNRKWTRLSMRSHSNNVYDTFDLNKDKTSKQGECLRNNLLSKSISHSKVSQLGEVFQQCVETVKKQVTQRKKINTLNFFKKGSPISIDQFKKIDFFRLLQLVFSNENIIQILYQALVNNKK